jgi:heme-degrading monooxygenase HmoA
MSEYLRSKTGTDESVTLIKPYTVPADEIDHFMDMYRQEARLMSTQPGFIRSRLHRPLTDTPEVRFVHIAEWRSGTALDKATDNPEWHAALQRMFDDPDLHITSEPAAYRLVNEFLSS